MILIDPNFVDKDKMLSQINQSFGSGLERAPSRQNGIGGFPAYRQAGRGTI
jgi:hypothetical protein